MEAYEGNTDPQEYLDAFRTRMTLVGAFDPIKCPAFPITLKKSDLKWFNSFSLKLIMKFFDILSWFLAHFITRKFKPKPTSSLLGFFQCQKESLQDYLK